MLCGSYDVSICIIINAGVQVIDETWFGGQQCQRKVEQSRRSNAGFIINAVSYQIWVSEIIFEF